MNNTPECLKKISSIQLLLDQMALANYKRTNSSELLDIISSIQEALDNQKDIELPVTIEEDNKEIKFNFWVYYNELEDFNNNEVVISKDLTGLSIDSTYGQIHFYEVFNMKKGRIENEYIDEDNYYRISTK